MITIMDAIKAINSNAKVVVRGDDIDDCEIEWHNDTAEISKADIKTKMAELQTAYDKAKYQRDRAKAYPSIPDQLDDIYHNGIDEWKKTIKAVKDKYAKG
jgi:hypothetical protein|tara:strand:+ start:533 stop:832 length:300 start_codon:yes stop_codon:yes gene_type:complete